LVWGFRTLELGHLTQLVLENLEMKTYQSSEAKFELNSNRDWEVVMAGALG
jgi:hypothetical protein